METSEETNARSKRIKLTDSGAMGAEGPVAKGVPLIAVLPRTGRVETGFLETGFLEPEGRRAIPREARLLQDELLVTQQPIRRKRESGSDTIW